MDKKEFALKQHEEWAGKLEIKSPRKTGDPGGSVRCLYPGSCRTLSGNLQGM